MKKLLTIVLLSTMCLSLSATTDSLTLNKDPIPDTSQITLSKVYSDVKDGLKGLGDALKVGSEHVYSVLVKQQYVNAMVFSLLFLFGLIGLFYFYSCFKSENRFEYEQKYNRQTDLYENIVDKTRWNDSHTFKTVITGFCTVGLLLPALFNIDIILTGFINPEYGALKDIMNFIK